MTPSDSGFLGSALTDRLTGNTSYTKLKECYAPIAGIYRIKFGLYIENVTATAFGRIYKNGSALGTERSTNSTTEVTFTEDLFFGQGDLIQVYCKTSNGIYGAHILNFKLFGNLTPCAVTLD